MNGNGKTNGEEEPTPTTQDTGVGPFLGQALSRFARKPDQKSQLAELPDTRNIDQQIASFNQFLESASPLNEWHKNKVLARFGEIPGPTQAQMPQGAPMPQISPEPSSQPGQPAASDKPSQQKPASQPGAAPTQPTAPAQKQQYFLNPATGSYEPLQTTSPETRAFLNPATGSYEPLQTSGQPVLRGLAYGPNSEGATEADQRQTHGPLGHLQTGDIAVSPNLLKLYPMGSRVNVVDSGGNIVLANARVADTSWYSEGHPTTNTFEIWNGPSLGSGYYLVASQ